MPAYRLRELEKKHSDLHRIIPHLVNEFGQFKAAQMIGLSTGSINRWLKDNGYKLKRQYIREGREEGAAS